MLLCRFDLSAQRIDYLFKHITTSNGLVSNQVGHVLQDKKGFFWIGTQTGLQRYDGKRFVTWQADVHDTAALHNDWITAIFEDSRNRLWIGTDPDGPYLLDRSNGKFFNYNMHLPSNAKKINGIWQFLEDSHGNIWVSAHNGYFMLNDKSNHFEPMDSLLQMQRAYASGMDIDKQGNLWFATTGGIKKLSADQKQLTDKNNNPQQLPIFNSTAAAGVIFDGFDNVWITSGFDRKLFRYNFKNNKFREYIFNGEAQGIYWSYWTGSLYNVCGLLETRSG